MENLKPTTEAIKSIEVKSELSAMPIFRSNDLYDSLFPEVAPLFAKGEEPAAEKIFAAIMQHKGQAVVLDNTCFEAIQNLDKVVLDDLPSELGLQEVPQDAGQVDMYAISELLKEKFDIVLPVYSNETIDGKIADALGYNFSPELVQGLFEIARQKSGAIKQVYILSNNITDHVGDFPKQDVLDVLKEKVRSEFGLEPNIVSTIAADEVAEGDLIIVDRHNPAVSLDEKKDGLNKIFPRQVSMLPFETELFNNEQFLGEQIQSKTVIKALRKAFEKSSKE